MGSLQWIGHNWFDLISVIGVVGGLLFTSYSLRSETKTRRIANLLSLTEGHREIWKQMLRNPLLNRILDPNADVSTMPITQQEEIFVNLVMTRLPTLNARKVIAALKRAGFEEARQRGSHLYLWHTKRQLETCVPTHGGDDLGRPLVRAIIQQAGLTEDEFRELL